MNLSPGSRNDLLSRQVSDARYFFLDLNSRTPRSSLALGGREQCNPDYHIDRESYAYSVLEYVAEGEGVARLDGQETRIGPGSLFVTRPNTRCEMRTDPGRPMTKYFLCLSGPSAAKRLAKALLPVAAVRKLSAHGEVRNVFEEIIREGSHVSDRAAEICELLLDLLVLKVADALSQPARSTDTAQENFLRCKALIDAHAERIASLDDLAKEAGLESSSVCRLFRRFQGTSPYQYLLRRKMIVAAEHLLSSRALVKEAAQRVGFADPYHFSRCFKAVHGVSPRELRRTA